MKLQKRIKDELTEQALPLAQQIAYVTDNIYQPMLNEVETKRSLINQIIALKNQHQDAWDSFILTHQKVHGMLNEKEWKNLHIQDLQNILTYFNTYLKEQGHQLLTTPPNSPSLLSASFD